MADNSASNPQNTWDGRRESIPVKLSWIPHTHVYHAHTRACTHREWINVKDDLKNQNFQKKKTLFLRFYIKMEWEQKGILEAYVYVIDDKIHTK